MGWSIGWDEHWQRDIGYGVPAYCDYPDCGEEIDRGLAHVCANQEPHGGEGCGLYFCGKHHPFCSDGEELYECCEQCHDGAEPFKPKPEHPDWIKFKHIDPSWAEWRRTKEGKLWMRKWPLN